MYSGEARVPRGAFNPRFDKSYSKTYSDAISLGPRHATSDPNAFHTFEGTTKLTVKVAEISARSAARRSRSYGKYSYNG